MVVANGNNIKNKSGNLRISGRAENNPVQLMIDPKTQDLDRAMRSILQISELVSKHVPAAVTKSITIHDDLAIVKIGAPSSAGQRETVLRLCEVNNSWIINGYAPETTVAANGDQKSRCMSIL